ncbi:MAG TPA: hypothetical protein VN923_14560, partial [Thermoanaerobaculia bacterium]|nr:hypothetical protein [Thermoanaerobaculia bacterium]
KENNPWVQEAPRFARRNPGHTVELFGIKIGSFGDEFHDSRQFVARFGDIARIETRGGDDVTVTLKDGMVFELEGGSNDVESKVIVWDGGDERGVDWRRIRKIEFLPAPARLPASEPRLYGKVTTRDGSFTGFVQWDQEECVGSDELDGETRDGDDVSLKMGTIRAIERRGSGSSTVTLSDGRRLVLSDTNDVDDDNRGIYVEDPRYGRVLIEWRAFERVDFKDGGSGPGYGAFKPGARLTGMVTTVDGRKLVGRLVYDLDESETTEMLDGNRHDVQYSIPFALVASIEPRSDAARVVLRSGEELLLDDTTDVSDDNAGMLIFEPKRTSPTYVRWDEVERVDFLAPGKG